MSQEYSRVVIYHGGCYDGSAAAWCVYRKFGEGTRFHATNVRNFEEDRCMPVLDGKEVWILDFCYDLETLRKIRGVATSLTVIDHHKTAMLPFGVRAADITWNHHVDTERSAAVLTYQLLRGSLGSVPWWMLHIEDRDLWRWSHEHSKAFGAHLHHLACKNLQPHPFNTFAIYDELETYGPEQRARFYEKGATIVELQEDEIANICKHAKLATFQEYRVYVTDSARFRSEVGNVLAEREDCDFAFICRYSLEKREWWVSLRGSKAKGIDLSAVAGRFGGGGHPCASGFTYAGPIHDLIQFTNDAECKA